MYRCRVYRLLPGGKEEQLFPCDTNHTTRSGAENCRHSKIGKDPGHRWEIRTGTDDAFIVAKGEGPRHWRRKGAMKHGVSWIYEEDYAEQTREIRILVGNAIVYRHHHPSDATPQRWGPDFAAGLAHGFSYFRQYPNYAGRWATLKAEIETAEEEDATQKPANPAFDFGEERIPSVRGGICFQDPFVAAGVEPTEGKKILQFPVKG